jgi:soluble lytic murein transglycosylase
MYKRRWFILGLCLCLSAEVSSAQNYLEKFQKYMMWSINLPTTPDPEFIEFISQTTPLSQKLRGKWLYQLAQKKDWKSYNLYYQPSNDISLQCYKQLALINQGQEQLALQNAKTLWLQNSSQPPACNSLFTWLLKTHDPKQRLMTERIQIALDNRNLSMATYLLNQYSPPHTGDSKLLHAIHQKPTRIADLTPGELHGDFYLYGLKRLISSNKMEEAIRFWQKPIASRVLNEKQNQAFLSFLVVYKAMRNSDDTPAWFAKIKPKYYTDIVLDWEIRYALKHHQWSTVTQLVPFSHQKDEPGLQYWLARSLEKQGKATESNAIYLTLSKTRQYYGFLASLRLKTNLNFANEPAINEHQRLKPYQPITQQIKTLYTTHHALEAARLIYDFASELPKDDKSAFVQWIHDDLQWHSEAVYISNMIDLNNQLSLRFPLVYQHDVFENAQHYQIPQELIYAIIRQESGYRENVISPAGAYGLMQIMPRTANTVARDQKINYKNQDQLFHSTQNIQIGTAYLQQLAKRYNHHPILMAAAYNAGPSQVNYWLRTHPPNQIDIWIDTLPWLETRNYLKNIISFYAVYQYRINEKSDLSWFMKKF